MKALRNLACAAIVAAVFCASAGMATADVAAHSNQNAPGVWYVENMGPNNRTFGTPNCGPKTQKEATGEVRYIDSKFITIARDDSNDLNNFYLYEGETEFTPSMEGVRVGSKVSLRSDDTGRVRWVRVIPFAEWLKNQQ